MRTQRQKRLRDALFLAVAAGAIALGLVSYGLGFLNNFERQSVDLRFDVRGTLGAPKDIVFVKVDDETFVELNQQWPFPRSLHARVIDRLGNDGAKAIAVDIQFSEYTAVAQDNALYLAIERQKGKVVLATTEVDANGVPNLIFGPDDLKAIGARAASGNLKTDRDGINRKLEYEVDGLKTFGIVAAEVALGREIRHSELGGDSVLIDYVGPARTVDSISYSRVLRGRFPAGRFKDKIVVVGSSAPVLQDIHTAPTGSGMPGPELQANAISTALRGFPLRATPTWLNVVVIVFFGLLAPVIGIRFSPLVFFPVALAVAGAYTVGAQLAFNEGWIVSYVYPLTALSAAAVGALVNHYVVAAFERERVRDVFSRFVPETVVDQVLQQAGTDLRLGGKAVTTTVMFSDLRGFTTSAERMPAEAVIDVLNHYLGEMSDAILRHGGTLLSYMGDGIYAVFGAPIEQPDHADRAFAAAQEMLDVRLPRFNTWMQEAGLGKGYRMGIGLNSGTVMSGNVGHERRVEYTAVGDVVNTASRIEGMTKGTPYMLFMAESTHAQLTQSPVELVFWNEVEIRGREQKLKLWGLQYDEEQAPAPAPLPEPAPLQA